MAGKKTTKGMAGGGKSKNTKYMAGGGRSKNTKYMAGGGMKKSKYMAAGGMKTEVGKEAKVEQYRDYVKRMFGGGMTTKGSSAGGRRDKRS
jgi:hypothetical protein|tara:strand:+ start:504 stop:776 length:273 start_codon:yes stop_codon:yes gene_type:complete